MVVYGHISNRTKESKKLNISVISMLLFLSQDGTGPKQLHQHTVDAIRNVSMLKTQLVNVQHQLQGVRTVLHSVPQNKQ